MVQVIAVCAILAALYALWIVGRADLLRLLQGTRQVRARVVRHQEGSDGFVPIYAFQLGERRCEVPGTLAHTTPTPPVGESVMLVFPAKRPDLAREPAPLARFLLYAGFAAWLGMFSDMLLGWI